MSFFLLSKVSNNAHPALYLLLYFIKLGVPSGYETLKLFVLTTDHLTALAP